MADELTAAPQPPLSPVPGAPIPTGQVALRCSVCNRISQWNATFAAANAGQAVACPLCAATVQLP